MTDKITISFPQFGPDKSKFDPNFIDVATNVIPYENFYGSFPSFQAFTEPLPDKPKGGFLSVLGNGVWIPFAATANTIYKFDFANSSWTDVGGNSAPYATGPNELWNFTQFGELVIATNGVDYPQYYNLALPNAKFETLSVDAPRAKNVTTVGDFLLFSNLTDMTERSLQWSGLNDPFWWTPGQRSSDLQTFPDDGEIMNIVGFEKGVIVFHEHCIREGTLSLDDLVMRFQKTVENHGTHARNSPVSTGAGTYYLSQDGFYRYMSAERQKVGVERIDNFFFGDCGLNDTYYAYAAEDPARKVIYWAYKSTENETEQTYDRILVYNYGVDRWSLVKPDFKISFIFNSVTPGYTLDNLHTTGYTLDSLPYSLDSRVWSGSLPTFAAFDEDYRLGFFSSTPMTAILQTADIPLTEGKRSVVLGVLPLTDARNTKGRVARRDYHGQNRTWDAQYPNNTITGVIPARSSGLLHRVEIEIPGGQEWSDIHGVEVTMRGEGHR